MASSNFRCVLGWPPPHVVVVHRRQVVVHERVGVQHLDRGCDPRGASPIDSEQPGHLHHQEPAQPFSASQRRVAHRLDQPQLMPLRQRQQGVDRLLHGLAVLGQGAGDVDAERRRRHHSIAFSASDPSARSTIACTRASASASFDSQ